MLWLIALALLASYYVGPGEFALVAMLSLLLVTVSIVGTLVGLRTVRHQDLI